MTPTLPIRLRRLALKHALRTLSPTSFRVLLHLASDSCPHTGRVWTTPLRVAEDLDERAAPGSIGAQMSASLVSEILEHLVERRHLKLWTRSHGALRCYEFGDLLAREAEAPANLPVERSP